MYFLEISMSSEEKTILAWGLGEIAKLDCWEKVWKIVSRLLHLKALIITLEVGEATF